jgi:hypothetical protein
VISVINLSVVFLFEIILFSLVGKSLNRLV